MSAFIDRVKAIPRGIETISEWLYNGTCPVDPATAQRRADVCLKCPHNQPGGVLSNVVASAIKRHLELKAKLGFRVLGEKSLYECDICRCQNRLKIWVPIETLSQHSSPDDNFPSYCWQITEQHDNPDCNPNQP